MTDKLIINKRTILDRLSTMRTLADRFANESFGDFDRDVFFRLSREIAGEIDILMEEAIRREEAS
ncbi:hypothetical protein [Mesorhizobium sp. LjRoot246]|uniref:hypothetical protein n=1 Tax=Mesorhizobium sp. LjRoot246 TaxID=3342294 RepID=UPI003ED06FE0